MTVFDTPVDRAPVSETMSSSRCTLGALLAGRLTGPGAANPVL
jgi:hypothetical protein